MVDNEKVPFILARLSYYAERHNGEFGMGVLLDALKSIVADTDRDAGTAALDYLPHLREMGYVEYVDTNTFCLTEKGKRDAA